MGIYYLLTEAGDVFEMDATVSFSLSESGRLTSYTVEEGATLSDHYVNENSRISMRGIITDLKGKNSPVGVKSTDDYIGGLLAAKNSSKPLVVYWRGSGPVAGTFRKDCMIERVSFEQSPSVGVSGQYHAYEVSIELSQIRKAQAATITQETFPQLKDSKTEKKTANATTVKPDSGKVGTTTSDTITDTNIKAPGEHFRGQVMKVGGVK